MTATPHTLTITVADNGWNCTVRCSCSWWFVSSRRETVEAAIKAHVEKEREGVSC